MFIIFTSPVSLRVGLKRAIDPIWSLKVYTVDRAVTKADEPIIYYLSDGPKHGFVHKGLLVVPPDTQLPPANAR